MFKQIQESKLNVLEKQKEELLTRKRSERSRYNELHIQLASTAIPTQNHFNFIERNFTKKNQFRNYQKYTALQQELSLEESKIAQSTTDQEILTLDTSISALKDCKTIYDLNLSPNEAISFLEERGITPVLDESDMTITEHPKDYSSISSLITVHKTFHMPKDNKIVTTKHASGYYNNNVTLNGKEYSFKVPAEIDSVHLALNNQVASHEMGNWDDCPFAIFTPLSDIDTSTLGAVEPEDTFSIGDFKFSKNTWFLCPQSMIEVAKKNNPNCNVLGYEGTRALEYATAFISQLGYSTENITKNGWSNPDSSKAFMDLREKTGLPSGKHANTQFYKDLKFLEQLNRAVSLSTLLRDNHLITSEKDIPNIVQQLNNQNKGFGNMLSSLCVPTAYLGERREEGTNALSIYISKMKDAGFDISPAYETALRNIYNINLLQCNQSNIGQISNIANASESEMSTLARFCNEIDGTMDGNSRAFNSLITSVVTSSIVHSHTKQYTTATSTQTLPEIDTIEMG